jgi:hypothetical protein
MQTTVKALQRMHADNGHSPGPSTPSDLCTAGHTQAYLSWGLPPDYVHLQLVEQVRRHVCGRHAQRRDVQSVRPGICNTSAILLPICHDVQCLYDSMACCVSIVGELDASATEGGKHKQVISRLQVPNGISFYGIDCHKNLVKASYASVSRQTRQVASLHAFLCPFEVQVRFKELLNRTARQPVCTHVAMHAIHLEHS